MPSKTVFLIGFIELASAVVLLTYVFSMQLKTFATKSPVQPLKRLLLIADIFLILAALPLMIVYAWYLWFPNKDLLWLTYVAVIANATAKVIIGVMLYLIYKFKE